MWRFKHLVLGWDYIRWRNSADSGVARVRVDAMGRAYYVRYPRTSVIDIIHTPEQVTWLTCPPHEYIARPRSTPPGHVCSERDELVKAESEIERLRAELAEARRECWERERERDIARGNAQMHMEAARDLLADVEALRGVAAEYDGWIRYHDAGNGDYRDYLRRVLDGRAATEGGV